MSCSRWWGWVAGEPVRLSWGPKLASFSIAVIKHLYQGNLQREDFIWGSVFQRVRVHEGRVEGAGSLWLEQ